VSIQTLLTACLLIAAIIAAAGAIVRAGVWTWQIGRKMNQLADDWAGEEPRHDGQPARPGVLARLASMEKALSGLPDIQGHMAALEERLAAVERQLQPNGGESLRDSVDRVEKAVTPDESGSNSDGRTASRTFANP